MRTYQVLRRRVEEEASWKEGAEQREAERLKLQATWEREAVKRINSARAPAEAGKPFRRKEPKIGRNAPCPCGSGKKYKKCCGRKGRR